MFIIILKYFRIFRIFLLRLKGNNMFVLRVSVLFLVYIYRVSYTDIWIFKFCVCVFRCMCVELYICVYMFRGFSFRCFLGVVFIF